MSEHHAEAAWKENAKFVADLINRVGFPIVVSAFLGWLVLFKMEEQKVVVVNTMERVVQALNNVADRIDTRPRR